MPSVAKLLLVGFTLAASDPTPVSLDSKVRPQSSSRLNEAYGESSKLTKPEVTVIQLDNLPTQTNQARGGEGRPAPQGAHCIRALGLPSFPSGILEIYAVARIQVFQGTKSKKRKVQIMIKPIIFTMEWHVIPMIIE